MRPLRDGVRHGGLLFLDRCGSKVGFSLMRADLEFESRDAVGTAGAGSRT